MNTSTLTLQSSRPQKVLGDAHLKFYLGQQTAAALPMRWVQEALVLSPHRLTPMPNMPACLLGLMNWRSRVLWVVDLSHLLGLPPYEPTARQYSIIILRVEPVCLGVAVQHVEGITWVTADSVQSTVGQRSAPLTAYLRGYVLQPKDVLVVLDAEAIVRSTALHQH